MRAKMCFHMKSGAGGCSPGSLFCFVVFLIMFCAPLAYGAEFEVLWWQSDTNIDIQDVNRDGTVLVGMFRQGSSDNQAMRWTKATGPLGLGWADNSAKNSQATCVSRNGNVVAGTSKHPLYLEPSAAIWTEAGGMRLIVVTTDEHRSFIYGMSNEGTVVAGEYLTEYGISWNAFVATDAAGSAPSVSTLPGYGWHNNAMAVSGDGMKVVGKVSKMNPVSGYYDVLAAVWTRSGSEWAVTTLEDLPGSTVTNEVAACQAEAVNLDGSVIVGKANNEQGYHAVRWVAGGAPQIIEPSGSTSSASIDVSSDGNVVLGGSSLGLYIWDPSNGARLLQDILVAGGVPAETFTNMTLTAVALSADGKTVAGLATDKTGSVHDWRRGPFRALLTEGSWRDGSSCGSHIYQLLLLN